MYLFIYFYYIYLFFNLLTRKDQPHIFVESLELN